MFVLSLGLRVVRPQRVLSVLLVLAGFSLFRHDRRQHIGVLLRRQGTGRFLVVRVSHLVGHRDLVHGLFLFNRVCDIRRHGRTTIHWGRVEKLEPYVDTRPTKSGVHGQIARDRPRRDQRPGGRASNGAHSLGL